MSSGLLLLVLPIVVAQFYPRPPLGAPPPRWLSAILPTGGQQNGFPPQQGGFNQQQGSFGQQPGGNGGGRPSKPYQAPITVLKEGKGYCNSNLPRQQAKAWQRQGNQNAFALMHKAIDAYNQNRCIQPPRPFESGFGQCPSRGVGNCDTATTRTQSIYINLTDTANGVRWILTNGIPDHCYQVEQDQANPNQACEHYRLMRIPINPVYTGQFREHRMGPVGVAISGGFLYNHKSAEAECNVAALQESPTMDPCDGHADPTCSYHYHKAPVCIKGWNTCALMGYISDGIPVYGKCVVAINGVPTQLKSGYIKIDGQLGCDASHFEYDKTASGGHLDQANGYRFTQDTTVYNGVGYHTFKAGDYAYFFTPEYPFIMAGSMSTVTNMCTLDPNIF